VWYQVRVEDPRERARRRFEAWYKRQDQMTQATLAKEVGRTQGWVSKVLARGPRLQDLDLVAGFMGCTAAELVAHGAKPITNSSAAVTEAVIDSEAQSRNAGGGEADQEAPSPVEALMPYATRVDPDLLALLSRLSADEQVRLREEVEALLGERWTRKARARDPKGKAP
jgi:hypothetical protein